VAAEGTLSLDKVTVRFGGITAVNGISLQVSAGERWAVIGPNGAGKTTLFRTISGEQRVTEGQVRMFGDDVTSHAPNRRAHAGLGRTYQVTNVFLGLTVRQNVAIAVQARRRGRLRFWWPMKMTGEIGDIVEDTLARVGLLVQSDRRVNELSHGEQRQLELALALAGKPRLLLLDEPAAGLSASERVLMRGLIEQLSRDLTLVLIEHDMALALDLVDMVMCMDNGTMIATGTPDEIRANEQVQSVYLRSD